MRRFWIALAVAALTLMAPAAFAQTPPPIDNGTPGHSVGHQPPGSVIFITPGTENTANHGVSDDEFEVPCAAFGGIGGCTPIEGDPEPVLDDEGNPIGFVCTPVPRQPTNANIGFIAPSLPVPRVETAPAGEALVQMEVGAWDATGAPLIEWQQYSTWGLSSTCQPLPPVLMGGYSAQPYQWEWNFSLDGHDPFGANGAGRYYNHIDDIGPGGQGDCYRPGAYLCWSGYHPYRDDHDYLIGVGVTWRIMAVPPGAGITEPSETRLGSQPEPFTVFEVRSGQTGAS